MTRINQIYHIFPLGILRRGLNNEPTTKDPMNFYTLEQIGKLIPHFKAMSTDAVLFGPVFQSDSHGYEPVDLRKIDDRIGTWSEFRSLIEKLHQNGIKVVLDAVLNHTSRNHFAYVDIRKRGSCSIYKNWYKGIAWDKPNRCGDSFTVDCWNNHQHLPKLNHFSDEVKSELKSVLKLWMEDLKIDGIRIDAADVLPLDFLAEISQFCHELNPEFWMMGEVVHGDYRLWLNDGRLDSVTNYEGYKSLWSSFNDSNFFEIGYSLNRLFCSEKGIYKGERLLLFNENHDVSRVYSVLKDKRDIYPLQMMFYTLPGVTSIYYGEEFGCEAEKRDEDDWNLRPCWEDVYTNTLEKSDLLNCIQRLCGFRKKLDALMYGDYKQIYVSNQQIAYLRTHKEQKLLIIINSGEGNMDLELELSSYGTMMREILNQDSLEIALDSAKTKVCIPPKWGRVLEIH
jgi:glycosidase